MDEKPFETMNVIPFVDIMLVLLTIVLTTSSFIASGRLTVNLPESSQSAAEHREDHRIELGLGGVIVFDNKPVSLEELAEELRGLKPDSVFMIRADREIPLQLFVDVADLLTQYKLYQSRHPDRESDLEVEKDEAAYHDMAWTADLAGDPCRAGGSMDPEFSSDQTGQIQAAGHGPGRAAQSPAG